MQTYFERSVTKNMYNIVRLWILLLRGFTVQPGPPIRVRMTDYKLILKKKENGK